MLINTLILIMVLLIARLLVVRFIRRTVSAPELRRKWLVSSRNGFLLLLLFGLMLIWGQELRTLALSLVAIALAFVVATKELILCISGSLVKSSSSAFSIGDRIQLKDFRGDVIDHGLLATTILEVGPAKDAQQRTGRMVVLPNSLFLSEPVVRESFTDKFGFQVFSVPFLREEDWRGARQALLDAANRFCSPYLEEVRAHMSRVAERRGIVVPGVDPCVTIRTPLAGEIHLVVRLPVRSGERADVEQTVLSEAFAESDFLSGESRADERRSKR